VTDEFHGDETLLTSHETPYFSLLAMSAKMVVFNVIKLSIKLSLRLACVGIRAHARTLHLTYVWWSAAGDLFSNLLV